jgi:hypothetical protein
MTSDESTVTLTTATVEVTSRVWYHGGSNDRSVDRLDILSIEDRTGAVHQPVWQDQPHVLFPGVETLRDGRRNRVRIAREACPVRLLFRERYEYDSYTDSEHCSSYQREYWVRYLGATDPDPGPPASPSGS